MYRLPELTRTSSDYRLDVYLKLGSQGGYYYYNDHGDIVEIKDSTGNKLNSYEYDIWGNLF